MIFVLGDLHLSDSMSYAEYIKDRRIAEKREILDFIVEQAEDCDKVVLMGDNFNSKNNSSEVIKEFVQLLDAFGKDKEIFILAGNHEKKGSGKSAIDFLKEINNPKWHVVNDSIYTHVEGDKFYHFCPYFHNAEMGVKTYKTTANKILKELTGGDILFLHHTVSNVRVTSGMSVDSFNEVIMPRKDLEKRYKLIVTGHIHLPQQVNRTIVAGSVFNSEVGETEKYVWKINEKDNKVEKIKLPGRAIYKLENPKIEDLEKIDKSSILKVIITNEDMKDKIEEMRGLLSKFDAYLLLEQYPNERKSVNLEGSIVDFSIDELLKLYAKAKKIDEKILVKGFELLK